MGLLTCQTTLLKMEISMSKPQHHLRKLWPMPPKLKLRPKKPQLKPLPQLKLLPLLPQLKKPPQHSFNCTEAEEALLNREPNQNQNHQDQRPLPQAHQSHQDQDQTEIEN